MRKFISNIAFKFILPLILAILFIICWDPFRVFFSYNDYYNHNPVNVNREEVCLRLLNKRSMGVSNIIIGSSRSHAYKTNYWSKKIHQPNQTMFHFDGSNYGLYRSLNAFKFLATKENVKLKNVLLVIDSDFFNEISNPSDCLFIQPPALSHESYFNYYLTFFLASIDFKFIYYNIVYFVTGKYFDFMKCYLIKSKNYHVCDSFTADIWYAYDKDIKRDSLGYYSKLIAKGVFYKRNNKVEMSKPLIGGLQLKLLKNISQIVEENNINIKIVISPLYNQIAFNPNDKMILFKLFGKENVFDFSGKNNLTENISNYYESSHYRPNVANQIMDSVYSEFDCQKR